MCEYSQSLTLDIFKVIMYKYLPSFASVIFMLKKQQQLPMTISAVCQPVQYSNVVLQLAVVVCVFY